MTNLKKLPKEVINKFRMQPYGLQYQKYGEYNDISKYNDDQILEMINGVYTYTKMFCVDGDYFINLNNVIEAVCELATVTYYKKPKIQDSKVVYRLSDIRTFYVKDYFLVTEDGNRHKITRYLCRNNAIRNGRNNYRGLYSIRNDYKTFLSFKQGNFPKDLFYPIKIFVNGIFYNDEYKIDNFKLEASIIIEPEV